MVIAMTDYERRIYELVSASHSHMTAEEVHKRLKGECPAVSLATVYNNLNKLWAAKLIRKVSVPGAPDRYDRAARHDHLVCRGCGKLTDICFSDLTPALQAQTDEEILYYDLKVIYLCPECRQKAKGEGKR